MPHRSDKFNILITGVTTSIGRHLAQHLVENSKVGVVLGVSRQEKPYYFNDLPPDKFIYRTCDILKHRELSNLFLSRTFREAKINTVVHLAFKRKVTPSAYGHKINIQGTKALLEKCLEDGGIQKFIFKSSDVVYSIKPHNPVYLDETADLNFSPYTDQWVKDRVDADMICRSFMDNKSMNIVVLRMTNIIGRNLKNQLNAYFESKPIVKTMGFNPMINLLHMRDVIQAITLAIEKKSAKGIYNIAGADTAPISTFAELTGSPMISVPEPLLPTVNWVQRKLGLTDYYYSVDKDRQKFTSLLDDSKARRELGYKPQGRVEL